MAAAMEMVGDGLGLARLYLQNAESPVITNIKQRSARRLTVERALPFLKLRSEVTDEDGRKGRIRSVWVSVEDRTPSLMLDIEYVDEPTARRGPRRMVPFCVQSGRLAPRRDPTVPWGSVPEGRIIIEPGRPIRRDATKQWAGSPPVERVLIEPTRPPKGRRDSAITFATPKHVALVTSAPPEAATMPPERGPRSGDQPRSSRLVRALGDLAAATRALGRAAARLAIRLHARVICAARRPKQLTASTEPSPHRG